MKILMKLTLAISVFSLMIMAVLYIQLYGYWHEKQENIINDKMVSIPSGAGLAQIATLLKKENLISDAQKFHYGMVLFSSPRALKAGHFHIPAQSSPKEIADIIIAGRVKSYEITIIEGLTSYQIVNLINQAQGFIGENLSLTDIPEGTLLPETYLYDHGQTRMEFINRLRKAHQDFLDEIMPVSGKFKGLNRREIVIMASLIEAEAKLADERMRVAAVFYNRLTKSMRLQTDPTIIYAITNGRNNLNRPLTRQDLKYDSPYNSYLHKGLPPTPINHPGKASLLAALNPLNSDEYYFVADGKGGHFFAKDYATHRENIRRYRAIINDKK